MGWENAKGIEREAVLSRLLLLLLGSHQDTWLWKLSVLKG